MLTDERTIGGNVGGTIDLDLTFPQELR